VSGSLSIADILDRAADIVAKGWAQAAYARTRTGRKIGATCRAATCWCAVGAIKKAAGIEDVLAPQVWDAARLPFGSPNALTEWNDAPGRTQSEVVAKLREAAALAREQSK
jgi:hypothetical protein